MALQQTEASIAPRPYSGAHTPCRLLAMARRAAASSSTRRLTVRRRLIRPVLRRRRAAAAAAAAASRSARPTSPHRRCTSSPHRHYAFPLAHPGKPAAARRGRNPRSGRGRSSCLPRRPAGSECMWPSPGPQSPRGIRGCRRTACSAVSACRSSTPWQPRKPIF